MKNAFYIILYFLLLYACANPVAPTGGDKDADAPVIKALSPANGTTNVKEGKIIIQFDEYFNFSQSEEKIFITPPMPEKPKYTIKGKSLVIKLPENLAENTTYNINFMGAVKDYNEGNEIEFFNYVFSTGATIDSSSISGQVKMAIDNKPVEKATIGLYLPSDTAILTKTKPRYLVKTNASGQFKVDYIKPGYYIIAALKENNNNLLYDAESELISIPTNSIAINGKEVLEQEIYMFSEEQKTKLGDYKLLKNREVIFNFNKPVEKLKLNTELYNPNDRYYFNGLKDTLHYFVSDTLLEETEFYINLDDAEKTDTVKINFSKSKIEGGVQLINANIPANDSIKVKFPYLIDNIDTGFIYLQDSLSNIIYKYNINNKILSLYANLQENNLYTLVINEGAIHYFNGKQNKVSQTLVVNTTEKVDKGDLILTIAQKEQYPNPVLQILKGKMIVYSQLIDNKELITFTDLSAGNYTIKIFADLNSNGKWDTGNLKQGLEAEKMLFYNENVEIKDNWDKDLTINF
ncbi:MAG: Ig-like domain-containing protein [Chitinophagales bacterium]|nr:Ig-like domain-containing protein [Chitinophagales bacterium]